MTDTPSVPADQTSPQTAESLLAEALAAAWPHYEPWPVEFDDDLDEVAARERRKMAGQLLAASPQLRAAIEGGERPGFREALAELIDAWDEAVYATVMSGSDFPPPLRGLDASDAVNNARALLTR